jgi:hypothetical protein
MAESTLKAHPMAHRITKRIEATSPVALGYGTYARVGLGRSRQSPWDTEGGTRRGGQRGVLGESDAREHHGIIGPAPVWTVVCDTPSARLGLDGGVGGILRCSCDAQHKIS